MNLNYLTNILPSQHFTYNFFCCAAMLLHAKITLYFNFEREGICLQSLRILGKIHVSRAWQDDAIT